MNTWKFARRARRLPLRDPILVRIQTRYLPVAGNCAVVIASNSDLGVKSPLSTMAERNDGIGSEPDEFMPPASPASSAVNAHASAELSRRFAVTRA